MSTVNAAGSSASVQSAMLALRQNVQMETIAAAAVTEIATQVAQQTAQQQAPQDSGADRSSESQGRGEKVNIKA